MKAAVTALLFGLAVLAGVADAQERKGTVAITREEYRGWPDTWRLSNGRIEARVVTAVGPRIIDLRAAGGRNLFYVRDAEVGRGGESEWMFRGGWRLWIAPERRETTYAPDNEACQAEVIASRTLRVVGPPQPAAGIQKVVEITLAEDEPRISVRSAIRNISDRPLTYAAWSLSVMRPGGRALAPLDVGPRDALDATRKLILWSYASFADKRYLIGDDLVQVDHSRVRRSPSTRAGRRGDESKIGVDSSQGWVAYALDRTLYVKRFPHDPQGTYPDGGATIEIYSSAEFLEVENLGPLTEVPAGGQLVATEDWWVLPAPNAATASLLELVKSTAGR